MRPGNLCYAAAILSVLAGHGATARAQTITTGGISGSVRGALGQPLDARVRISHDSTGSVVEINASGGHFLAPGLEAGGPYTVTARSLGFTPQRIVGVYLGVGTVNMVDFTLRPLASNLDTVIVTSAQDVEARARTSGGVGRTISESIVDHVPASNRDLYDFLRLVPQASTKTSLPSPGLSAAGAGFRYNNFLIDGVSERTLSGNVSSAFGGNRSVPLAAVQEYQVMLSPYDVRYGDFSGAFVNAVTKSGTNTFRGSAFVFGRNDRLARRLDGDSSASYERAQYGLLLSGPLLRDRIHFLVAPELQYLTDPAPGPYVGQASSASPSVPITPADLDRFAGIMRQYGLSAGSANAVENKNPLRNLFTRVDVALPAWNSRLVLWNNYSGSENATFSRAAPDTFSLSSYQLTRISQARMTAAHLHTAIPRAGGAYHELLVSVRSEGSVANGAVAQPIVRVAVPSATSSGRVTLNSGTNEAAQMGGSSSGSFNVKDNLTLPLGERHVLTVGAELERYRVKREGTTSALGIWNFGSLDDFAAGRAERYEVGIDFGNASATLAGTQYAAYAGDQWQPKDGLMLTGGLRGDLLTFGSRAPYNHDVDSIFARRTDQMPRPRVELSPRLGFVWDMSRARHDRLRGGVGVFTGRYPLAWPHSQLLAHGDGNRTLICNVLGSSLNYPPSFMPSSPPPKACAGGASLTANQRGDVDLLEPNLRLIRSARGSLALEHEILGGLLLTNELLVTRGLSDVAIRNLNLLAPRGTDPYGRVMYDSIAPNGLVRLPTRRSDFSEAIDLVNAPGLRGYQATARLERTRQTGFSGSLSYTYSHARDVETPLRVNARGTMLWASARVVSGSHDDFTRTLSSNDIPHRVIAAGTYAAPWTRARSEVSFSYVGESGRPFTYIAFGADGKGDLNADGSNANDPIYVPRNALDPAEIRITGLSDSTGADKSASAVAARELGQRRALDQFIERTPCLRRQRGRIMERNSCREPWSNTTVASLRQQLPAAGRAFDLELDVFNLLNLLNAQWGLRREAAPSLLEQVFQTAGPVQSSQPILRYDAGRATWTTLAAESRFQLQLAARYRF